MSEGSSTRRKFLAVVGTSGAATLGGCLDVINSEGEDIKDTDGDGVIDSEDYAPRDASVQRAEQVKEDSGTTNPEKSTTSDEETTSEETTESTTTERTTTSQDSSLSFSWESGKKSGWEKTGVAYGYSDHVYKFQIVTDEAITGRYSPQTECLNDDVYVKSPDFTSEFNGSAQTVSGKFRLEGDLDASDVNSNQFRVVDSTGKSNGSVRFSHGNRKIVWRGESYTNLQDFTPGNVYDIQIECSDTTYKVTINGETYSGLKPKQGQSATIHSVNINSYNGGGSGPGAYDDSIYFTWDDISVR